jgi:hypothetical protein
MPLTSDSTKQALIFALQLLRDHDEEISRLNASLQAIVNVLAERSSEFQALHVDAMNALRNAEKAYDAQGHPSTDHSIARMLRLLQEA